MSKRSSGNKKKPSFLVRLAMFFGFRPKLFKMRSKSSRPSPLPPSPLQSPPREQNILTSHNVENQELQKVIKQLKPIKINAETQTPPPIAPKPTSRPTLLEDVGKISTDLLSTINTQKSIAAPRPNQIQANTDNESPEAPTPKPTPKPRPRKLETQGEQTLENAQKEIDRVVAEHVTAHEKKIGLSEINHAIKENQKIITDTFVKLRTSQDPVKDLTNLLDIFDNITDLKVGIVRSKVAEEKGISHIGSNEKSSVIIRDARNQIELQAQSNNETKIYEKKEDAPESTTTIITGQARGILKLIDLSQGVKDDEKKAMQQDVIAQLETYSKSIRNLGYEIKSTDRLKLAKDFAQNMSNILNNSELSFNDQKLSELKPKALAKVMLYARDFANLESADSPSIITITSNIAKDNDNSLYAVSASVPLNPISQEIKRDHYGANLQGQEWFKNLGKAEQGLLMLYEDKLKSGRHMIPTQLRELAGIKNGYLEQASVIDKEGKSKGSARMIRSGTLAQNLGSGKDAVEITKKNMEHLQSLSGDKKLVIDTLNHNLGSILSYVSPDIKTERDIQSTMQIAAKQLVDQGTKIDFYNHAISLDLNKTKNMHDIGELYKKTNEAGVQDTNILCTSCKSGKDRTGLAAFKGMFEWINGKYNSSKTGKNLLAEDASERIIKAAHQEELAARNTRGIFGLKVKVALMWLKDHVYSNKVNNLIDNKISDLNAITLKTDSNSKKSSFTEMLNAEKSQSSGRARK